MISIRFLDGTDERVVAAMKARGPKIKVNVLRALDQSMIELQSRIMQKLSGEVLKSRTGGLLSSVRKDPVSEAGTTLVGNVKVGGGLFWWAIVHEKGGEKDYPIEPGIVTGRSDKKALAFFPSGSVGSGLGTSAMTKLRFRLGKKRGQLRPNKLGEVAAAGGVVVKKVIHHPLPKRSFAQTSLDELRGKIIQNIYSAAAKALR